MRRSRPGRRRTIAAAAAVVCTMLGTAACSRPAVPPEPGAPPAALSASTGRESSPGSPGPARIELSAEAIKQAGITTETIRVAPFSVTLSVPARLSPTPVTPEETEARLAYHAANARFTQTSAAAERLRRLAADNVVSSKSVQAAEADLAQARVDRARAETALRNLGLDAARENAFPPADLWALADIYDSQVPQIKPGARAWVRVESFPDEAFDAKVVALASSLKPQSRTLTVRIAVRDPRRRLRPQEPATVEVEVAARPALSVPAQALLYEADERVLFVRRGNGSFEMVRVRVGAEQAGRAEILSGVREGDAIVTRGAQTLLGELFKARIPSDEDDRKGGPPGDDDGAKPGRT